MREDLFKYGPGNIREFLKENLVAILYTIIFHLVILILLVFIKVDGLKNDIELGVLLDFTEEKSLEELLMEEMVEVPADWLEHVYAVREQASNRAVNINDRVESDLSTEEYVRDLLDELESQKNEEFLKDREKWEEIISSYVFDEEPVKKAEEMEEEAPFTGPTNISYEFSDPPQDRKKEYLVVPVYRCEGSGTVVLDISVGRDGSVSEPSIVSVSTSDSPCFSEAAIEAALASRFRSDMNAPSRQRARITYQFIAQ